MKEELSKHLFIENQDLWADDFKNIQTDRELTINCYKNAIALPLKPLFIGSKSSKKYVGGICDENSDFIAGSQIGRPNFCCDSSYSVKNSKLSVSEENVIFGGVFYEHFGVMLLQSLTRLWFLSDKNYTNEKIIFLTEHNNNNADKFCDEITKLIGITNYEIITEPTKFKSISIPDESRIWGKYISPRFFDVFDIIVKKANQKYQKTHSKVYLSRTKIKKKYNATDCLNEEFYENFYKKRGYYICHPQELPLKKQIQIISNADDIVSTYGTLTHFITIFMKSSANQTMLLRADNKDRWFCAQAQLLSAKKVNWYLIAAANNPLPTWHDGGIFLLSPTKFFEKYLIENNIKFESEELKVEIPSQVISKYYSIWSIIFSSPSMFSKLERPDLIPILQSLYFQSTGKCLNIKGWDLNAKP